MATSSRQGKRLASRPTQARIIDLKPYPGNPRRGNLEAIAESLRVNGQYRPIVVNSRTNEILAGNHTREAAKALGWEQIEVTWVDADPQMAKRIVLADNRTNDLADYETSALADLLGELEDLDGTGYEQGDLDQLLAELAESRSSGRTTLPHSRSRRSPSRATSGPWAAIASSAPTPARLPPTAAFWVAPNAARPSCGPTLPTASTTRARPKRRCEFRVIEGSD